VSQPDLPNVLHGISFDVAAQEKVGIVGSTGCGKSTLALSFFRFVEAAGGRIVIDGLGEHDSPRRSALVLMIR
jgi:ABC-type multidrug transport system fused ATPase/permease subunit